MIGHNKGAIKLSFSGPLQPLISKNPPPVQTDPNVQVDECGQPIRYGEGGPTFVGNEEEARQRAHLWIPKSEQLPPNKCPGPKEAVETFTRKDCTVEYEPFCQDIPGKSLCGQCPYSSAIQILRNTPDKIGNLGQCRYCSGGTVCSNNGANGICGDVCVTAPPINDGDDTVVVNNKNYYVGCSECNANPTVFGYNGSSYETCNFYYNQCVDFDCGKILDNCR